jgi:hypothetical protein
MPDELVQALDNSPEAIASLMRELAELKEQNPQVGTLPQDAAAPNTAPAPSPAIPPPSALTPQPPIDDAKRSKPNPLFVNGVNPTIRLAGEDWPIPTLAIKQNRMVGPALTRVLRKMRQIGEQRLRSLDDESKDAMLATANPEMLGLLGPEVTLRTRVWETTDFALEVDTEFLDDLGTALFWALSKAHPYLTREEFDDKPIRIIEMLQALSIVAEQTGMLEKRDPSVGPLAAMTPR